MKIKETPQDKTYLDGYGKKFLYAVDEDGNYTTVPTTGWEVEDIVLNDAISEYKEKAEDARKRFKENQTSPIEYFMNIRYMDLKTFSQATGIPKWKIKRHFKPKNFNKLKDDKLKHYAHIFRIEFDALKNFNGDPFEN